MSEVMALLDNSRIVERLESVEQTLEHLLKQFNKMYNAVVGNEEFDQEGIISRIKKLENDNRGYKSLKNKLIGAFLVGGVAWSVIWELIKMVIKK
jgi:hypothetical protein